MNEGKINSTPFLRARVWLNLRKPLIRVVPITLKERMMCLVQYEKLPSFCFFCGCMGHEVSECGDGRHPAEKCEWGDWLRVPFMAMSVIRDDRGARGRGRGRGQGRGAGRGSGVEDAFEDMDIIVEEPELGDENTKKASDGNPDHPVEWLGRLTGWNILPSTQGRSVLWPRRKRRGQGRVEMVWRRNKTFQMQDRRSPSRRVAGHNETFSLELQGALEPSCSSFASRSSEAYKPRCVLPV